MDQMSLRELFIELIREYDTVYTRVTAENDWKNPFRELISTKIPDTITAVLNIQAPYKVVGSYGKGRWTKVPWISVFDTRITSSAQAGVYIVYLLNKDTKSLFLTFESAATEAMSPKLDKDGKKQFVGIVGKISSQVTDRLDEKVKRIREGIRDAYFSTDKNIDSGSDGYNAGAIYYKKYSLDEFPTEEVLIDDLKRMLDIYKKYFSDIHNELGAEGKNNIDEGGEEKMTIKGDVNAIQAFIASKGFRYDAGLIENFYLSLKSKPFVILAGTSGTGKTRLVRLFAEAVGATAANGHYKLVSVRPDWSDSTDLFGHTDLNGNFVPGAITEFVEQAMKDADQDESHPYFLCLDEMNLARVEYYLSDVLSVIETREFRNGRIVTDEIPLSGHIPLILPENLYIIGTVNMDETTFPFSKKVLDRANTIEFSYVDLIPEFSEDIDALQPLDVDNDFLKTEYLILKQCADEQDAVQEYCLELQVINEILKTANAHIGYRVRDEIVFYLLNNKKAQLLKENEALDNQILQKILPRIQGSSYAVRDMLCELFHYCAGDYEGYQTDSGEIAKNMFRKLKTGDAKYPKSAEKIAYMMRRYEEDGFTSYWL